MTITPGKEKATLSILTGRTAEHRSGIKAGATFCETRVQRCDPREVTQPVNLPQQRVSNVSILVDAVGQATVEKTGRANTGSAGALARKPFTPGSRRFFSATNVSRFELNAREDAPVPGY